MSKPPVRRARRSGGIRAPAGAGPATVVFAQRGEQHRSDGHVDADTERVGAGDDPQQALLGELLYRVGGNGEHPGVMDADPGAQQFGQRLAKSGAEAEITDGLPSASGRLVGDLGAEQGLRPLDGSGLGEVDDVNGGLAVGDGFSIVSWIGVRGVYSNSRVPAAGRR